MIKPRKILLVLESSGAGVGRHIMDLARQLDRRGHCVHLIYSGLRMEEAFRRELEALGQVRSHRVDMRRAPHPSDLSAVLKVRRYIKESGPFDVIHGHSSKGGAVARLAATGLPGIRIYTPHALRTLDPLLHPAARWLYRTIERTLCYFTDGIILVSDEEKAHAMTLGLTPNKLFVVPNGIVPETVSSREEARHSLQFRDDKVYLGFVGRFVPQKDPASLVTAFAQLAPRFTNARLVILGDGPLSAELHDLAARLGITEQIIWLTEVAGPALMPALDVFVMPSRYEAFPYVLLEAAVAGLPIVATPVGGTSAVVADQTNGYLTALQHPDQLAGNLSKLLDEPSLRAKMGQASREIARSFTIESMTERTLDTYKTVTNDETWTTA